MNMTWIKLTALLLFYLIVLISLGVFVFMFIGGQTLNLGFPHVLVNFLSYDPLPELMQGATVAILTILISFGIGMVIELLSGGNNQQEEDISHLDLEVILYERWQFGRFLSFVVLSTTLPFLMFIENILFSGIIFLGWVISYGVLIVQTLRVYKWFTSDKDEFRLTYLSDFPQGREAYNWQRVWNTENLEQEERYIKVFFEHIEDNINREDWRRAHQLLNEINNLMTHRGQVKVRNLFIRKKYFSKLLEWHVLLWKVELKNNQEDEHHKMCSFDLLRGKISEMISGSIRKGNDNDLYNCFNQLKKHMENYKADNYVDDEGKEHFYYQNSEFYEVILNEERSNPHPIKFWRQRFPKEWKITASNYDNEIVKEWEVKFREWSKAIIEDKQCLQSPRLERVNRYLFPEVNSFMWARIIALKVREDFKSNESYIKQIVENPPNFGLPDFNLREKSEPSKEQNLEKDISAVRYENDSSKWEKTIELAELLFGDTLFTQENINKWLKDLEQLDDTPEKLRWQGFLTDLQEYKNGKVNDNNE